MEIDKASVSVHYRLPWFLRFAAKTLNVVSKKLTTRLLWRIFTGPIKFKIPQREQAFYQATSESTLILESIDRKIAVYRIPSEGRRILFVHGWNGRSGQFYTLVKEMAKLGFDITAIDLPGHGKSDNGQITLPEITAAISEISRTQDPFDILITHSFGGVAALNSIRQGAIFDKIVLISLGVYEIRPMFETFVGLFGLNEAYYADKLFLRAETRFGVSPREFGPNEFVDKITTETLLVHCIADVEAKSKISEEVHTKMPNSQIFLTKNLGHRKLLGNAEVVNKITEFIL